MAIDEIHQPNVGTPAFAKGNTARRKLWAVVTTIAFAVFWMMGLYLVAAIASGDGMHWAQPVMVVLGLALGLYGRREVERD